MNTPNSSSPESVLQGNGDASHNKKKIIVAVHGIGDQVRFATVQGVTAQFCRKAGYPMTIPLGHFQAQTTTGNEAYFPELPGNLGFAEFYWADIPRTVATEGYTLEETKEWAQTLVQRLSARKSDLDPNVNYKLVEKIVGEMVETIGTLESLGFLAAKAGVFDFDLNKVLVDYVDDVQLVAEFHRSRGEILQRFRSFMFDLERANPGVEIYIVAHSEGTVVSWLGLLDALWTEPTPEWIKHVRGYMTIGSPIDKHLVLWPELFNAGYSMFLSTDIINLESFAGKLKAPFVPGTPAQFVANQLSPAGQTLLASFSGGESDQLRQVLADDLNQIIRAGRLYQPGCFAKVKLSPGTAELLKARPTGESLIRLNRLLLQDAFPELYTKRKFDWEDPPIYNRAGQIKWRNYYDFGDPVGFELDTARLWLETQDVHVFEFRGPAPGRPKQECDDIGFARYPLPGAAHNDYWKDEGVFDHFIQDVMGSEAEKKPDPPGTHWWAWVTSYVASYGVALLMLMVGVFLVNRSVAAFNLGAAHVKAETVVSGGGPTTAVEKSPGQVALENAGNIVGMAILLAGVTVLARMPRLVNLHLSPKWLVIATGVFLAAAGVYSVLVSDEMQRHLGRVPQLLLGWLTRTPTWSTLLGAGLVAVASGYGSRLFPKAGMRPLILCGGLAVSLIVVHLLRTAHNTNSPWGVALAGAAFLYLWWLAALFFDLVFVWHRYIRHGVALDRLRPAAHKRIKDKAEHDKATKDAREARRRAAAGQVPQPNPV